MRCCGSSLREAGVEQPGREQVDLDVVAADLARERLGEPAQRRLRRRVVHRRVDHALGGERSDVQDRARRARGSSCREHGAREQVGALDVDVHHRVPVRLLEQRDRQDLVDARVVDEHVDAAPGRRRRSSTASCAWAASATDPGTRAAARRRQPRRGARVASSASAVFGRVGEAPRARPARANASPSASPRPREPPVIEAALAVERLGGAPPSRRRFPDGASGSERKTRCRPLRSFHARGCSHEVRLLLAVEHVVAADRESCCRRRSSWCRSTARRARRRRSPRPCASARRRPWRRAPRPAAPPSA